MEILLLPALPGQRPALEDMLASLSVWLPTGVMPKLRPAIVMLAVPAVAASVLPGQMPADLQVWLAAGSAAWVASLVLVWMQPGCRLPLLPAGSSPNGAALLYFPRWPVYP